jgi:hypothetical protein
MGYIIEDMYLAGIPQTILVGGLASRGIACHWTAGAPGRAGAVATARYFVNNTRNASYHEIWWWDGTTFGVLRIVPIDRAAHSMNPNQPPWEPVPLVREILGDKWWNPNSYSYTVSFAGMPEDLAAAIRSPGFVGYATRRIRELLAQETTISHPRPLFNHGEGQPSTRYDWGTELRPLIYAQLFGDPLPGMEDEMEFRNPIVTQEWDTVKNWLPGFTRPDGSTGTFTEVVRVKSIAEGTINGVDSRLLDYGPDHEALVIGRKGLANPGTRYVGAQIVEVVKEIPTGITQAQFDKAVADATLAGTEAGKTTEKSRLRSFLGL